ncbi:hypothetical protein GF339_03665 [candidate division KSB3 bacterium]|uniref:Uncharacterized protein n=1 Tax=candidate division KSB3 bacterium TaxID=2044937 RepID=A0A9D5Q4K5_9BACT|nr:hypothetical protein [candidate division KSB3 bacterium]MBD3323655.1 hypothetical protein [candidate division KSB3 bacterium]
MNELIKLLSNNPTATSSIIIVISFAVCSVILIYLIAFFQGREVSFWPPKIGKRPAKLIDTPHSSSMSNKRNSDTKNLSHHDVKLFKDSQALFEYVIHKMKSAEKSIDDLSWGLQQSMSRTKLQSVSSDKYYETRILCASKNNIQYREVMTFPKETVYGKVRLEVAEEMTEKNIDGYQLRYYDFLHENIPPLSNFLIIDSEEVILASHRGVVMPIEGETYLAINQKDIVDWFQDYYNAIWAGAETIKEPSREANSELLQRIKQRFSS